MRHASSKNERGSAMVILLTIVVVAAAISASVILPNVARHRAGQVMINQERAFMIAESGIDWGVAKIRETGGALPDPASETIAPSTMGSATVTYTAGDANLLDDNGDGVVDDAGEADYITIDSVGISGGETRAIRVLARSAVEVPDIEAAIQFNVEVPILTLSGQSFLVEGEDHDLDGNVLVGGTDKYGMASPAVEQDLIDQMASNEYDQITGIGSDPSVGQVDALDLDRIVEQAKSAMTIEFASGTHSGGTYGTATEDGIEIVYCASDIHFSGQLEGAGVLVVDGDLRSSGQFLWQGIVIVRGTARFTGGGAGKRIIGAFLVGEEVDSSSSSTSVTLTGTIDILYSSEAVEVANGGLSIMSILSWTEIGAP